MCNFLANSLLLTTNDKKLSGKQNLFSHKNNNITYILPRYLASLIFANTCNFPINCEGLILAGFENVLTFIIAFPKLAKWFARHC